MLTAVNVGIDIKKDIFAESTLEKLKILAPVIVIPDLLTPGINDKIWKKLIYIAVLKWDICTKIKSSYIKNNIIII